MNLLIASLLLAVVPQANLSSPDSAQAGSTVLLDARGSVADFPLAWTVTPPGPILLQMDQNGRTGVVALFTANQPGDYDVILAASGWTDDTKTRFGLSVAAHRITVGSPTPPLPPQPTDPLSLAALAWRGDFSQSYVTAASAIHARKPLKDTQAALKASVASTFQARFAPWAPLMPPNGTEPTTDAQWQALENLMTAVSGAFK